MDSNASAEVITISDSMDTSDTKNDSTDKAPQQPAATEFTFHGLQEQQRKEVKLSEEEATKVEATEVSVSAEVPKAFVVVVFLCEKKAPFQCLVDRNG